MLASARPRCFKVCTSSRRRRRGLEAASLDELLEQVRPNVKTRSIFSPPHVVFELLSDSELGFLLRCGPGSEGVGAVPSLPELGPGGGRDCGGLRGVLPVSAQQRSTDGAGEGRDVDAEQGEHQVTQCCSSDSNWCCWCVSLTAHLIFSLF